MKKILLIAVAIATSLAVSAQYKAPQVVANGGFHRAPSSGVKNSMSALKAAQKAKVYASECDVTLTKDGDVLVITPGWHPNRKAAKKVNVYRSTKDQILNIRYTNGEKVSTLEEFLARTAKKPKTKLILELKNQGSIKREQELAEKVVALVQQAGAEDLVEYIAFHPYTCFALARLAPNAKIAYLNGDYTPQYVKGMGCSGISYNIGKLKKRAAWIKQAHKLGMTVNVWTVNKEQDITWCIRNGVDFITTDDVVLTKNLIKSLCNKK